LLFESVSFTAVNLTDDHFRTTNTHFSLWGRMVSISTEEVQPRPETWNHQPSRLLQRAESNVVQQLFVQTPL
jgi:hypothetical protein